MCYLKTFWLIFWPLKGPLVLFQTWSRGSGSSITERWIRGSGSTFPKCGSQDPDPCQNEMDPKRCWEVSCPLVGRGSSNLSSWLLKNILPPHWEVKLLPELLAAERDYAHRGKVNLLPELLVLKKTCLLVGRWSSYLSSWLLSLPSRAKVKFFPFWSENSIVFLNHTSAPVGTCQCNFLPF